MYHHRTRFKHRRKYIILGCLLLAAGLLVFFILNHKNNKNDNSSRETQGTVTHINQPSDNTKLLVNEPTFNMTLQGPWKEIGRNKDSRFNSIQWQYTKKFYEARTLTIYVDKLPSTLAVNYLLPATVVDNTIQAGQLSENCTTFTKDAKPIEKRNPTSPEPIESLPAVWQKVNFLCDNGNVTRQVVGVSTSEGVNTVSVAGNNKGIHKYFFVYNDQNFQLDSSFLVNALESFRAK